MREGLSPSNPRGGVSLSRNLSTDLMNVNEKSRERDEEWASDHWYTFKAAQIMASKIMFTMRLT